MKKRMSVIVWIVVLILSLAACAPGGAPQEPTVEQEKSANMPNPASVYCEQQGGRVEIRTNAEGQYGVCVFEDGSECDEWAYYRGECSPGGASAKAVQIPDPAAARDAVLEYLRGQNLTVPAGDLVWTEENLTAEGLLGATHLRYAVEDWTIDVSFPIVAPQATVYSVTVTHTADSFVWQGEVDATGAVTERGDGPGVGLANPASVYCEQQGGRVEMRTNDEGTYGVCVFSDGSECDEWAFYRGECSPASGD
jgi:putative hemolysin